MIYDKKYDKFFFIWKIGLISAGILFVIYYLSVVNPNKIKSNTEDLEKNKIYTISIYVGLSPMGKTHYPCYDFYYDNIKYNCELDSYRNSSNDLTLIQEKRFGDRFVLELNTLNPFINRIRLDLPVPDDILCAPERGWKEMPNWDQERSKGNTGALWDRSKVQRPISKKDPRQLYLLYGFCAFCLIVVIRDVIDFFEELPDMLKRLPSYLKNELPHLLAKLFKSAIREVKEVIGELKETLVNLPATLKKFWYGDDNH